MNKIVNATTLATITPIDMRDYYPYVWLKNNGDVDVYASAYSNMQGGSDNTVDLRAGEAVRIEAQGRYVYVQGATDIEAHGQDHADCPFESTGGGGSGGTIYRTTTPLTDGATTNPITVNGEPVTVKSGDFAIYNKAEFLFDGTEWNELGDMSGLGDLAYKDNASGTAVTNVVYDSANERFIITVGTVTVS